MTHTIFDWTPVKLFDWAPVKLFAARGRGLCDKPYRLQPHRTQLTRRTQLPLVRWGIIGPAIRAFHTGGSFVEGLEGGAVQREGVHLVVVDGVFVATLLLALLQYLRRERTGEGWGGQKGG